MSGRQASGKRPRPGFTLVELLIALAMLAAISLLGYRALVSLADSEARLVSEGERWRTLDGFFARIESDMRATLPRDARHGAATEPAWLARTDAGGNAEVHLSRAASELGSDAGGVGQRIGYRLREGNVEVLYWPRFDRRAGAEPVAHAIVGGVSRLRVEHLDGSGAWRERWPGPGESVLPRAVRVELALAGGEVVDRTLVLR
jgi:general secretion pathway protein J